MRSFNMLSSLRGSHPPKTFRAKDNPIFYEGGASFLRFNEVGSDYLLTNQHPPFDEANPSIMNPPFHWHINQSEHFSIVSGTCDIFKDDADKPWVTISAEDETNSPKTAVIPKKVYHTLRNASTDKPMIVDVTLAPEDFEGEQRFFRNFFGYLDDCKKAGLPPSVFQLFVFLNEADTPLGIRLPTVWLSLLASRLLLFSVAWWGRNILGYKTSYPEHYESST